MELNFFSTENKELKTGSKCPYFLQRNNKSCFCHHFRKAFLQIPIPTPKTTTIKKPVVEIYAKSVWDKITKEILTHTHILALYRKGGKSVQLPWVLLHDFLMKVNGYIELSDGWYMANVGIFFIHFNCSLALFKQNPGKYL